MSEPTGGGMYRCACGMFYLNDFRPEIEVAGSHHSEQCCKITQPIVTNREEMGNE